MITSQLTYPIAQLPPLRSMETATKTKKETEFRSEQFTFTIPRNKKGLIEELRRLKKEDSINMSAYILDSLEKLMGIGYKQGLIA